MVRAPVRDPKNDGKVKFEDQLVIYPHELLSYLFNAVGVVVPHEDRQAYWRESRAAGEEWALQTDASELQSPWYIWRLSQAQHSVHCPKDLRDLLEHLPLAATCHPLWPLPAVVV